MGDRTNTTGRQWVDDVVGRIEKLFLKMMNYR